MLIYQSDDSYYKFNYYVYEWIISSLVFLCVEGQWSSGTFFFWFSSVHLVHKRVCHIFSEQAARARPVADQSRWFRFRIVYSLLTGKILAKIFARPGEPPWTVSKTATTDIFCHDGIPEIDVRPEPPPQSRMGPWRKSTNVTAWRDEGGGMVFRKLSRFLKRHPQGHFYAFWSKHEKDYNLQTVIEERGGFKNCQDIKV